MTDTTSDLDRLADFARTHRAQVEARERAEAADRRERECRSAAEDAARDYAVCFAALGDVPPDLTWTGYPRGRDTDRFRIHATAYLGQGLFLAHRTYRRPAGDQPRTRVGEFTIVAAPFPDNDHYTGPPHHAAHVADLITLAECLHLIQARRSHAASHTLETETR